jgi:hypothetical protein
METMGLLGDPETRHIFQVLPDIIPNLQELLLTAD